MVGLPNGMRAAKELNREGSFAVSCNMKIWSLFNTIIKQQA